MRHQVGAFLQYFINYLILLSGVSNIQDIIVIEEYEAPDRGLLTVLYK